MGWFTPEAWSHYLHVHIVLGAQTAGYPSYVSMQYKMFGISFEGDVVFNPLKWMLSGLRCLCRGLG